MKTKLIFRILHISKLQKMSRPAPKVRANVGKYQCQHVPPCLHQDGTPVRFTDSHLRCSNPIHVSKGIGLEFLGLSAAVPLMTCPKCEGQFVDLTKHVKCLGRPSKFTSASASGSGVSSKPSAKPNASASGPSNTEWKWITAHKSNATQHDYTTVLNWHGEFEVNGQVVEGGYAGLGALFLERKERVVCLHNKWFPELVKALQKVAGLRVEDDKGYQIVVPGHFSCHNLASFKITRVEQLSQWNELVYELTEMNLLTKWTLAQLTYDYWKANCQDDVQYLQGADYEFAKRGYSGYRKGATLGQWESQLELEGLDLDYNELLDGDEEDLYVQLDGNSFYSSVMTSQALTPTYYPVGPCRNSQEGQAEFEKGTVGLYAVKFQCPEGLGRAVLGVRAGKRVEWTLSGGSGVYTEVDLQHALDWGYTLEFEGPCLLWDAVGHPFDDFVGNLFVLKQAEQDTERRTVLKFMLNSLSGKLGQDEAGCAISKRIPITAEEACERDDAGLGFDREGELFYKPAVDATVSSERVKPNYKPNHLGAWMMSWTRVQFQQVHDVIGPVSVYEHTDSVRVPLSAYRRLREAGWIHASVLGLLKIEYGLIYKYEQRAGEYKLWFIRPDGTHGTHHSGA